mgnify:CR=1 FL=1
MSSTIEMTQGDTAPVLTATLYDDTALTTPVNLTGATVTFWVTTTAGAVLVSNGSVTIVSAANGTVSYAWQTGDTSTLGTHRGRFKIVFSDATIMHVPNFEDITVRIIDGI